jgi:signal transduction histidine kinase
MHGERSLRFALDDIANQLGAAVDSRFDFTVKAGAPDETLDRLAMLINFVIETARRTLADVHEKNKRLSELDRMKSVFLANVSHELRTPLALILGPTEKCINSGLLPEQLHRDLEVVMRNARSLLKAVNDLLDVSKLEAGKVEPCYARTDLTELVSLGCSLFEGVARERDIAFSIQTPQTAPAELDLEMFRRVLLNLLSNAFKFAPNGGNVSCALEVQGTYLILRVQDNGPGIPTEMREKVFERFMQIEKDATRRYGGTGLGLAIAKEFTELLRGSINVTDAPGGGALFRVTLPVCAPAGACVDAVSTRAQETKDEAAVIEELSSLTATGEMPEGRTSEKGLVLVVEDNPQMNRFIMESLCLSYRVISARNGREALEKAAIHKPDLILADIMMPEMSGDAMISELRSNPDFDDTPVLVLSAKADDELRITLLKHGAQDYVVKPFSEEEIRTRVQNLVTVKRTRDLLKGELATSEQDLEELAREISLKKFELQKSLEEVRAARDESERLLHLRDEFIAVAGHELRTPLTPLNIQRQMIEVVMHSDVPESIKSRKIEHFLEASHRQIATLTQLVETLLDVSRFQLGTFSLKVEQGVNLEQLAREVVERYRPQWESSRSRVEVDAKLSPKGAWDRLRIEQVVTNLLTNAIKYGKGKPIRVVVSGDAEHARISIQDQGIGISAEDQARIFNRFERVGSIKRFAGLGLGLYVTRQIVAAHGGTIQLESSPARGSTFTVELPLGGVPESISQNEIAA